MLEGMLSKVASVNVAATPEEKEAVYRFRYQVYVEELGKSVPAADHERKRLWDPEDDEEGAVIYYTGTPAEITGTLRVRIWPVGGVAPEIRDKFSFGLFPGVDRMVTAEAGRLIIVRSMRGKLILPALVRAGYEEFVGRHGGYLVFSCCAPGLVRIYRRLGYRPYSGDLVSTEDGLRVPLVMITSDADYFRQVNSPLVPLQRQLFAPGKLPPLDLAPYRALVGDATGTESDPEAIWREVENGLVADQEKEPLFLDRLPDGSLKRLAEKGFLMDVQEGQLVTRENLQEKEVFVILKGVFEVVARRKRLAILHKGEVFGELAFFTEAGLRTASIRAMTEGRLLVLRRRFLDELRQEDLKLACQILFNLGRIMAGRLSGMIRPEGS